VAEFLKLPRGPEHGPSDVLTCILGCLKKGFGGNKKQKTQVFTGHAAVDLFAENNSFGIFCQTFGATEEFQRGHLTTEMSLHKPRWFRFRNKCAIEVREQLKIAKELVGDVPVEGSSDDPGVLPRRIIMRRKESYVEFYRGEEGLSNTALGMCLMLRIDILICGRGSS